MPRRTVPADQEDRVTKVEEGELVVIDVQGEPKEFHAEPNCLYDQLVARFQALEPQP